VGEIAINTPNYKSAVFSEVYIGFVPMIADHDLVKKSFGPMIADHDLVKKRSTIISWMLR
jgi:hypothetical protein